MDFQERFNQIQREIRDLKTAQALAGFVSFNTATGQIPAQTYSGTYTWTIQYEDVGDTNAPITVLAAPGTGDTLLEYDPGTNSQKYERHRTNETVYVATIFRVISSRPIASITKDF